MLEAIDGLRKADAALVERLNALVVGAVADWRALMGDRVFCGEPQQDAALRLAVLDACSSDDPAVIRRLLELGYPLDRSVCGEETPLTQACRAGSHVVAQAVLDGSKSVGSSPVVFAPGITSDLVEALVARDVAFDVEAVLSAASSGKIEVALQIATCARRHGDWGNLRALALARHDLELETADGIERGSTGSYATADEHRMFASRFAELRRRLGEYDA